MTLNSEGDIKGIKAGKKQYQYEPSNQGFRYYLPAVGNNEIFINRSSGAYIFRPNGSEILVEQQTSKLRLYQGIISYKIFIIFKYKSKKKLKI